MFRVYVEENLKRMYYSAIDGLTIMFIRKQAKFDGIDEIFLNLNPSNISASPPPSLHPSLAVL